MLSAPNGDRATLESDLSTFGANGSRDAQGSTLCPQRAAASPGPASCRWANAINSVDRHLE